MSKEAYPPMHTAEHLLNQTMIRLFKTERCFSAHIEKKKSKCDYHFGRALSAGEISRIENEMNKLIKQDLPVKTELMTREIAASLFDLGRLPDDVQGILRVVRIGDYDACPCRGEHVASTGAIGNFRIVSARHEDGILRIIYKLPT